MLKVMPKNKRLLFRLFFILQLALVQVVQAPPAHDDAHRRAVSDSTLKHVRVEHGTFRSRMMASPFPVELRQEGRQIYAQTKNEQILPIYTGTGAYYATFRIFRGVNWINGLPRGTYLINGRKFIIS